MPVESQWLFLSAYHCVSVFDSMFCTNVIMSVCNCGHTVYTVNVTVFSVFPAVTYRWQIWKHTMNLYITLQFGHRCVSVTRLNLFCFHRLRLSWSTSSAGSSTVPSSLMASLRPVESWSWRCRWWSGWKVEKLHLLTYTNPDQLPLSQTQCILRIISVRIMKYWCPSRLYLNYSVSITWYWLMTLTLKLRCATKLIHLPLLDKTSPQASYSQIVVQPISDWFFQFYLPFKWACSCCPCYHSDLETNQLSAVCSLKLYVQYNDNICW